MGQKLTIDASITIPIYNIGIGMADDLRYRNRHYRKYHNGKSGNIIDRFMSDIRYLKT